MAESAVSVVTLVILVATLSGLAIAIYYCIARYMERAQREQNRVLFIPTEPTSTAVDFSEVINRR